MHNTRLLTCEKRKERAAYANDLNGFVSDKVEENGSRFQSDGGFFS